MTGRNAILGLLIGLTAVAAGCRGTVKTSDKSIVWVDPAEAQELSHGDKNLLGKRTVAVFVDCRNPAAYETGHIPGAVSLPFQDVSDDHKAVLAGYHTLIVYAKTTTTRRPMP